MHGTAIFPNIKITLNVTFVCVNECNIKMEIS